MERTAGSESFALGKEIPQFSLPGTDGSDYTNVWLEEADVSMVLFTCNHCPYVKGSDELVHGTINTFLEKGLKAVAISSNNATQYPDDSFEAMREKSQSEGFRFPYLYDESQEVARLFDAQCTPEVYIFVKSKLAYHGTVCNSPRDSSQVTDNYLEKALTQAFEKGECAPPFINPLGCSIKWK